LGGLAADLLGVDVERADELHVVDVVRTELHVHQSGNGVLGGGVLVILQTLEQRGRAVPHTDDAKTNCAHALRSFLSVDRRRFPLVEAAGAPRRSDLIKPSSHAMSCSVAS